MRLHPIPASSIQSGRHASSTRTPLRCGHGFAHIKHLARSKTMGFSSREDALPSRLERRKTPPERPPPSFVCHYRSHGGIFQNTRNQDEGLVHTQHAPLIRLLFALSIRPQSARARRVPTPASPDPSTPPQATTPRAVSKRPSCAFQQHRMWAGTKHKKHRMYTAGAPAPAADALRKKVGAQASPDASRVS